MSFTTINSFCEPDENPITPYNDFKDWLYKNYGGVILENMITKSLKFKVNFYLPEKNVAIDFIDISKLKDDIKIYHFQKRAIDCMKKNIRLIQVYEHKWLMSQEIYESIILDAIGIHKKILDANRCFLDEIDNAEYSRFLEENHINGNIHGGKHLYGLFEVNRQMVAVAGFGHSRGYIPHVYELNRYCVKKGYKIEGALNRLVKHSLKAFDQNKIVAYIDLANCFGEEYFKMGFYIDGFTKPIREFYGNGYFLSKFVSEQYMVNNIFDKYDPNITKEQNLIADGFKKMYSCGMIRVYYDR